MRVYITKEGGINEVSESEGFLAVVEDITAARTLVQGDSGKVLALNAAEGVAITLPSVALSGWNIKIVTKAAFATTNFTVVSPTAKIQGGAIVNSVNVPAANETTITFSATAETIGDYIEIVSDGVNYHVNGVIFAAGGVTFA